MGAYVALMLVSVRWLHHHPESTLRVAIALLPLIPLALTCLAVARFVRNTDEMLRRLHLDALAIAAGITAFLALTYGCLEMGGLPRLSAWWTVVSIDMFWGLSVFALNRRYQ